MKPTESGAAVNKPTGDNARKGAVRSSQLKTKIEGEETWTKRSEKTGHFMDQKKALAQGRAQREEERAGSRGN